MTCINIYAANDNDSTIEEIGGIEDQTGVLLPDVNDTAETEAIPNFGSLIFSMSAQGVTDLITTYGNSAKTIRYSNISNYSVLVRGTVTCTGAGHTVTQIRVGLCYYDSYHQVFSTDSAWFGAFPNGTASHKRILKSSLDANKIYYGFIKNATAYGVPNGGSVSGSASFYDSPQIIDPDIQ